jgi:hypothetical protein
VSARGVRGIGRSSSISGSAVTYAVGGEGGVNAGAVSRGGGTEVSPNGAANTGGGGGGANGVRGSNGPGGTGGSGIVIVRYEI